ncbi:MAG: hypothetical protein AAFZ15_19565 [Bacteroidota bacterium]
MKIYTLMILALVALSPLTADAQIDLPNNCGSTTVDFSGFAGTGFTPTPGAGQLDSDTWSTSGFGDNVPFGGTGTSGDPARGTTTGGVTTGGVYSLNNGGDAALWIQSAGSDFTPGDIKLKSCNTSGSDVADVDISYDIVYLNDQPRANSLNFAYSLDDVTYVPVPALDFITPEASDALGIQTEPRMTTLAGVNIPNGMCIFFRWSGDDVSGGGSRDEYGIDNITFCAAGGIVPPPPPPPPTGTSLCIASDDFDTPTNLLGRTITVDQPFMTLGDLWGISSSFTDDPINAPFAIIDDSKLNCANFFANDVSGVIPCDYGNRFFGMVDTENNDNMGPVSAEWEFDVSSAINLTSVDIFMGAMGDFESDDIFTWSYSIDGSPFTTIFTLFANESIDDFEYIMADGDTVALNDPMTVDGTILTNNLTKFNATINGAGSILTLRVEGMGNGGTEAIAWDNICINGLSAGSAVPTMSEWGMFLFALIMISFGVVFLFNAQRKLAMSGTGTYSASTNFRRFPLDKEVFKSSMKHAAGLAVVGFGFIFLVWGEIVPADLIGMALTIPVVAYLIHMVKLFGQK